MPPKAFIPTARMPEPTTRSFTVFETTSATPYFFNFHKADLGNFTVIGPSCSGKTVLMNFLAAQAQRFAPRTIFFDKDRGAEIFLRAIGGHYATLRPGEACHAARGLPTLPDRPTPLIMNHRAGKTQCPFFFAIFDLRVRVPCNRMPNPAKPVGAGSLQRGQDWLDPVSQFQIGVADDRRRGAAWSVKPGRRRRRQSLDKLYLADRAQFRRPLRPIHRPRLYKHGRADVVAAIEVSRELVQQIALIGDAFEPMVPEVMVRIADRDLRFQRLFAGQRQPVVSAVRHLCTSLLAICRRA